MKTEQSMEFKYSNLEHNIFCVMSNYLSFRSSLQLLYHLNVIIVQCYILYYRTILYNIIIPFKEFMSTWHSCPLYTMSAADRFQLTLYCNKLHYIIAYNIIFVHFYTDPKGLINKKAIDIFSMWNPRSWMAFNRVVYVRHQNGKMEQYSCFVSIFNNTRRAIFHCRKS